MLSAILYGDQELERRRFWWGEGLPRRRLGEGGSIRGRPLREIFRAPRLTGIGSPRCSTGED